MNYDELNEFIDDARAWLSYHGIASGTQIDTAYKVVPVFDDNGNCTGEEEQLAVVWPNGWICYGARTIVEGYSNIK